MVPPESVYVFPACVTVVVTVLEVLLPPRTTTVTVLEDLAVSYLPLAVTVTLPLYELLSVNPLPSVIEYVPYIPV